MFGRVERVCLILDVHNQCVPSGLQRYPNRLGKIQLNVHPLVLILRKLPSKIDICKVKVFIWIERNHVNVKICLIQMTKVEVVIHLGVEYDLHFPKYADGVDIG